MITKEQFAAYVAVQESGIVNMFIISVVQELSGLTKAEILEIMKTYGELQTKYAEEVSK